MFSKNIINMIECSAREYANTASNIKSSTCFLQRLQDLTGHVFNQSQLESPEDLNSVLSLLQKHLQAERKKQKYRKSLYNYNRHVSLLQLLETIKKARQNSVPPCLK